MKRSTKTFDKYQLYCDAVQEPEADIHFLKQRYKRVRGKNPVSLREDFCGTGYLSCEWVKQGPRYTAVGIDLDPETIGYGKSYVRKELLPHQRDRISYLRRNVLTCGNIKADIVVAFNFSYWIFHARKDLLKYFRSVRRAMKRGSLFFLDVKGGDEVVNRRVERTKYKGYTYYWECESFNPINHECVYAIHFKLNGQRMRKRVFTYHWRYWTVPEIVDLLKEAGFRQAIVYGEGDAHGGKGNGIFRPMKTMEECHVWFAYLMAIP